MLTLGIDPEFIPFEFIDEGEYKGIASDYVKIIEERTGIDFQVVPNLTWAQAYFQALEGNIDVLPAVSKTAAREEFFEFSSMYYEIRRVIVTKNTNTEIRNISDLYGKTVAVQINSSHHTFLLEYPQINLSLYNNVGHALTAVSDGSEIAFVGNLATSDYLIKSNGLTNLRFSALPSDTPIGLYFAVQKDNLVLLSIINKALASITTAERVEINARWVTVDTLDQTDYGPLLRVILGVLVFIVFAGGISSYWIVRLKKEIDARKKTAKQLEEAKRIAEEANHVKSTFMARMSHEIRTPLNAITGMSYILKKTPVNMTQRMYIERITQASQNMLSLINDILDYSKMEASKIEFETISFSLDQVVHTLMSIMAVKLEDKGLGFRFSKDSNIPTYFIGDPKRLEQILLNLLNNAIKFTSHGEIVFEIHQTAKEGKIHHLTFTIKDTGIGMSKETLDNIFTPFTQADASINRRFGGSGLGLSIVKHLAELMGGEVHVYSTVNEGSTFVIELSLKADTEKEIALKAESSTVLFKDIRVLVLDKNTATLNMIETYLHSFGLNCELTTSPNAALSLLENANGQLKSPYDLLILDYETPSEQGLEFVTKLSNNPTIQKMPKVLMIVPMQRTDLFDQIDQQKIDGAIGKPVISSILHNALLEIFIHKAVELTTNEIDDPNKTMAKVHKKVLIVDDNNTNQLIAKLLLEQSGFDVITANDGKEAVDIYQKQSTQIDLILMDIHMPNMNGYEASSAIKQMYPNAIIVAMTAEVTPGVKESCKQAGMEQYISKPFDPDMLIKLIQDILKSKGQNIQFETAVINVQKGIRQLGDNADLYALVVQEYYKENQPTYAALEKAIEIKAYTEARQILHKIKGSTGGIGADIVVTHISALQKAIADNDESQIKHHLKAFKVVFNEVLSFIETHYPLNGGNAK
jgi:signal transduction histidine kinase/DNA-binding response OmpR family regulator